MSKTIESLAQEIQNKKGESIIKEAIAKAKASKEYNFFITIDENASNDIKTNNLLSGIPFATKDNLSTKGILSTASSNTLKDYVPFFDATVITKLKELGAVNIGKTTMDELGMGGTGTTAATGVVKNPWDKTRITGGSSAGSAGCVASGIVPFALGSDTGDSIRKPAAYCGVVGYKPTYGLVSRYGLFAFASSLDHVGTLTRNVKDAAIVVDAIKGKDDKDMTSLDSSDINLVASLTEKLDNKKLCYIKEICNIEEYANPSEDLKYCLNNFKEVLKKCEQIGIEVEEVSVDKSLLAAIFPTYRIISCAEATSNYSNLTGIIFGPRGQGKTVEDIMMDHRSKGFCSLIKRRFIIGSYILQKENQEKYFKKAQKVRRLIVDKINDLFTKYDGLILPCSGSCAPKIVKIKDQKQDDILENHLAIGNFGGFPSISIPCGFLHNLPIGVNITGKVLDDANVLNIAYNLEKTMNYKNQIAKEQK